MSGKVVAFSGGIGGAKLALGLLQVIAPEVLLVVCNTGDDFVHLGLHVSPDVDTVLYTVSGLADPVRGWGRSDETWGCMEALAALGGEDWFALGDRDLALHLRRTTMLANGHSLTEVTDAIRMSLGVSAQIFPVSDDPVRTIIVTPEGEMPFQDYFVRQRCTPTVLSLSYAGAQTARVSQPVAAALADSSLRAIILCPSNPLLSLMPMLAMPALKSCLKRRTAPLVAVSPLIGGRAVKGPTVSNMEQLGLEPNALGVAKLLADVADGFIVDHADVALVPAIEDLGLQVRLADTIMNSLADRARVAEATLELADALADQGHRP